MFGFTKRPLFLIAWKNLKTYPVRIFLTTSSIILGVAVIIASNIFSESNKSAFDNLFSGIYEGVDLVVQPIQEDFAEGFSGDGGQGPISFEVKKIPDERIEEISNLPSVKAAWGEVLGFAQFIKIVAGETVLISNGFAPTFGAAWDSNPYAQQWSLVEGLSLIHISEPTRLGMISYAVFCLKKNAEVPKISKIFAILDPIIFPVMASVAGTIFVAANRVITSSGADVPNATIVKPINTGDKLNFLAIASADSIILSALYKRLSLIHI